MALVGPIRIRVQTKPRIRCRIVPRLIPLNATVGVHSVTTLPPGSPATVVNVGTPSAVSLDFGIPVGATGVPGNFQGPASSVMDDIVTFADATGTVGKDSGVAISSLAPKNNAAFTGTTTLAGDPASALQAATKQYVDNVAAGLDVKASARAATTANITLSAPQTIDGVGVIAGDRVAVKNQTTTSQNGIYVVAAGAWARSADMDAWTEVPGANVWIEEGTVNGDTAWVCTSNAGGTIGTTAITWTQFGGSGAYQPLDADLTAIAALATTAYGRSLLTSLVGQMNGTATNDNASAGNVGEYMESILVVGSAVSLVSATAKTVTSITLTPGDWDVDGIASFFPASTTSVTAFAGSFSLVTNTLDVTPGRVISPPMTTTVYNGTVAIHATMPHERFSVSANTTVFLVSQSTFTVSTNVAYGKLRARRVR